MLGLGRALEKAIRMGRTAGEGFPGGKRGLFWVGGDLCARVLSRVRQSGGVRWRGVKSAIGGDQFGRRSSSIHPSIHPPVLVGRTFISGPTPRGREETTVE